MFMSIYGKHLVHSVSIHQKKIPFDLDYRQDMSLIVYYGTLSSSKLLL